MVSTTTNYNLTLYDSSDTIELFLDYRLDMCGTTNSNMTKIETALTDIQSSIDTLETQRGAIPVSATYNSGSLYEATGISAITSYTTDLKIILKLSQTSNGAVTLNINSLGVKTVYKIDNDGNVQNIDGNDLGKNREYYLKYNGTAWVVVSAIQNVGVYKKNTETLSTTKTLNDYSASIQYLDPNGVNRDILLPAESAFNPIFIIHNTADGDEDLVVKEDSGTTTIGTVRQNQVGYFYSNGTSWRGYISPFARTTGDILYASGASEITSLPIGSSGNVLTVSGGVPAWSGDVTSAVSQATTSLAGKSELATVAEVNTGTDTSRTITPDALAGSNLGTKGIIVQLVEPSTDCSTGVKFVFKVPDAWNGMNVVNFEGVAMTAGTTGSMIVSVERYRGSWVEICSGLITFDSGSTTISSVTINTSNDDIQTADLIRMTIDSVHTTPAQGCSITMEVRLP